MTNQENRSKAAADPTAGSGQDLRQKAEALATERTARTLEDGAALSPEQISKILRELQVHQIELEMQNDELRTAQAKIEAGRDRYIDLYDLAPVGYCTLSEKGLILEANLTTATLLGTARDKLVKQPIFRFILKEDRDIYYLHKKHLLETGDLQTFELRMIPKDEKIIWVQLTIIAIEEPDGKPVNRIILSNITDRKRVEEALKESEQEFRTLTNSGMALIWTSGTDKLCNYFNDIWIKFTGRTVEQEMGVGWTEGVYPDDLQQCLDIYTGAFDRREKFSMEYRMRRYDGEYRWIVDEGCPRYDSKGEFLGYIGHCLDITKRKTAEEEVRRNELRLRSLVDILQSPFDNIKDLLDYALEKAIQLTGSKIGYIYHYNEDRKEFVLNAWSKDVLPACTVVQPQTCYELTKTGLWGEAVRQRKPIIVNDFQAAHALKKGCPQGHAQLFKFLTVPIFKGEHIVSVVGLANKETDYEQTDVLQISLLMDSVWKIIESIRAEKENTKLAMQLQQSQKMEAIGTLAGGIAHDFNNILGAILGYAEMARDDCSSGLVDSKDLDQVIKAGHRARDLVKQILTFSRQTEAQKIPLQAARIVKDSIQLLRSSIPVTIAIQQDIDPKTDLILADPTQIHQIVMNLCANAYHAMEETGGTLTISLGNKFLTQQDTISTTHAQTGHFVQLAIRDSGSGIPLEIQEKMFDPYFTTKKTGKGTGMGLAIVHGIVKSYGGFITCHSEVGVGTVFKINLPSLSEQDLPEIEKVEMPPVGTEHILLIDDEPMLAEMGKTMLERLGYTVTVRMNSLEALTTFRNQPDAFNLVITDQTMPGITGIDLARRMLQIRPDLPIILCTGFSSIISEEKAKSVGVKGFALKPLAKKDIAALIREVLDFQSLTQLPSQVFL